LVRQEGDGVGEAVVPERGSEEARMQPRELRNTSGEAMVAIAIAKSFSVQT
jgi:hypothetical protein